MQPPKAKSTPFTRTLSAQISLFQQSATKENDIDEKKEVGRVEKAMQKHIVVLPISNQPAYN